MIARDSAPTSGTAVGPGLRLGTDCGPRSRPLKVRGKRLDHPLLHDANKGLRRRVIQLLRNAYNVRREGNIVFVCGGNDPDHMRPRFRDYCKSNHPEFEIFLPEFAMKNYFSAPDSEQFDIANFEELVAELSHVIVLFPEAPGSFAETGYFSAMPKLAQKTILAMDSRWQGHDSFISMGPAKKINEVSRFHGIIQTPYENPAFADIVKRVKRIEFSKTKKSLAIGAFSDASTYEKFCLIHKCFDILSIATIDDVIYVLRGLFKNNLSTSAIAQITSILVGASYLKQIGEYGHYYINRDKGDLLTTRTGFAGEESGISLELASIYNSGDQDFLSILEDAKNAD